MSRRSPLIAALAVALIVAVQPGVHAQDTFASGRGSTADVRADERAALAVRIDSLLEEQARYHRLLNERRMTRAAVAAALHADTTIVGPFLFVNRDTPPAAAVSALANAWNARAEMVGDAVTRLDGVIISMNLGARDLASGRSNPTVHHYRIGSRRGQPDYNDAAARVIAAALADALPATVKDWIGNGSLDSPDAFVWAYRDLATSGAAPARACYARDIDACVLALTGDAAPLMNPATRMSLLQHALDLGGRGAYARLVADAPGTAERLAHASNRPLHDVMTTWRAAVQEARPRVHAGVARAGMWTMLWLLCLGLLSMRSTRWRLG